MEKVPDKKRRSYWIDPHVQWAVIQKTLVMNASLVLLLWAADKFFFFRMGKIGRDLGFPADHVYFSFLQEQADMKFWAFIWTSVIISVVGTLIGLRFSHRLAGPIFRLKKELRRLNEGEKIEEIVLRDADFFREVVDELNLVVGRFGAKKEQKQEQKKDVA